MNSIDKKFIPVMLTPFKQDGTIDFDALTELTAFYLKAGAGGLFANCLSSEMYDLSPDERIKLVRHVLNIADATVPVVATGSFGNNLDEHADSIKRMYDTGVSAVIIITNQIAPQNMDDHAFTEYVEKLLNITHDIPLGFYECPMPYKRLVTPGQINRLARRYPLVYLKDTCMVLDKIKEKLAAAENTGLAIYDAFMGHAVESLRAGAAGLSCIQGNYCPELIVWLCNHYNNENLSAEVDAVQQFFRQQMVLMHEIYPLTAKYFLKKRGLNIASFCRQPTGGFTKEIREKIDQLYIDCNSLQQNLGIN
jgi:4-hydroxy-tetrahydrodipicolinate synthase